jgi:hypothetical protein
LKGKLDTQLVKKWSNPFSSAIVNFFGAKNPFYKDHIQQKIFLEDMGLLIIKIHLSMQFFEKSMENKPMFAFVLKIFFFL